MSIKVQINSLEALERLIGGDSAIELEIRGNIVQEFARKHLKSIAENIELGEIREVIGGLYKDAVLPRANYNSPYKINPESDLGKALLNMAHLGIEDFFKPAREELIEKKNRQLNNIDSRGALALSEISKAVENAVEKIDNISKEELEKIVEKVISQKLKS